MIEKIAEIGSSSVVERTAPKKTGASDFGEMLTRALGEVNSNQVEAMKLQEKFIIDPESVEAHEITTAMAKANMSLTLAQTVIDRMLKAWQEITTTR